MSVEFRFKLRDLSPENCQTLRMNGALDTLIQELHPHINYDYRTMGPAEFRANYLRRAFLRRVLWEAFKRIVHNTATVGRGEIQMLDNLEVLRNFTEEFYRSYFPTNSEHPWEHVKALRDQLDGCEESRGHFKALGGVHFVIDVLQTDHRFHGNHTRHESCLSFRHYSLQVLTIMIAKDHNVNFTVGLNRAFIYTLLNLISSARNRGFIQVICWFLDYLIREVYHPSISECRVVKCLLDTAKSTEDQMVSEMLLKTLKNLVSSSGKHAIDLCEIDGSLHYLITTFMFDNMDGIEYPPEELSLSVVAGEILRNLAYYSYHEPVMKAFRDRDACYIFTLQLNSKSNELVRLACIILYLLVKDSSEEQFKLIELDALSSFEQLSNSPDKVIQEFSKNVFNSLLSHIQFSTEATPQEPDNSNGWLGVV